MLSTASNRILGQITSAIRLSGEKSFGLAPAEYAELMDAVIEAAAKSKAIICLPAPVVDEKNFAHG